MKSNGRRLVLITVLAVFGPAHAGHEPPIYPSFYPQEIRIESVDPASAAGLLRESKIHAYVGDEPTFADPMPKSIDYVESLGSYVVLALNPASSLVKDRESGCAITRSMIRTLAGANEGFFFHPYPITTYHADYLHHFDLADAAKKRFLDGPAGAPDPALRGLKVRAKGALAQELVRSRWQAGTSEWDVTLEEIDARDLVAPHTFSVNGWLGPPWLKEGWFHAYLLLAGTLPDKAAKSRAEALALRLQRGDYDSTEEKINVERDLVKLLTGACRTVVAGYRARREYYSAEYSRGIENIAYDSHAGFNSAIFIRTVKLKDFPWNGWLRLGIAGQPAAAWNPVGGFTDEAGRLIWWALGDPALFPEPYNARWTLNRIGDVKATAGR